VRERERKEKRFKGIVYPPATKQVKICQHLLTLMLFQTGMTISSMSSNFEDQLKRMQKHHESITKVVHTT